MCLTILLKIFIRFYAGMGTRRIFCKKSKAGARGEGLRAWGPEALGHRGLGGLEPQRGRTDENPPPLFYRTLSPLGTVPKRLQSPLENSEEMVAQIRIQKMTFLTKNIQVPTPLGAGESGTKDFLQNGLKTFSQKKKKSEMPKIFIIRRCLFLMRIFQAPTSELDFLPKWSGTHFFNKSRTFQKTLKITFSENEVFD